MLLLNYSTKDSVFDSVYHHKLYVAMDGPEFEHFSKDRLVFSVLLLISDIFDGKLSTLILCEIIFLPKYL